MATVSTQGATISDREGTLLILGVAGVVLYAVWKAGGLADRAADVVGGAGATISDAVGGTGQLIQDTRKDVSTGLGTIIDTNANLWNTAASNSRELADAIGDRIRGHDDDRAAARRETALGYHYPQGVADLLKPIQEKQVRDLRNMPGPYRGSI